VSARRVVPLLLASIRRLCRIAEDTGALLIPGHDPVAWAALPAELT
jgi:hypothetical protein